MAARDRREPDGMGMSAVLDVVDVPTEGGGFAIREVPDLEPAPVVVAEAVLPTLGEAFAVVRAALERHFQDNLPALGECELAQALHSDGNVAVAWRRIVLLLEMAINASLRQ